MKITAIKNFKSFINKCIYPNRINKSSEIIKVEALNFHKIPLERNPFTDIFQKQNSTQPITNIVNDINKKNLANSILDTKHINQETYEKFSNDELIAIRAQLDNSFIFNAKHIISTSQITKSILDKKYGEGKYTFVSIGRSLSAMAKCLEFMGVKTRQIPFSKRGAEEAQEAVNEMIEQKGFEKYKKFLEKNLQQTENNRYLICDYACTGETLKIFKTLLEHPKVKLNQKRNEYIGINKFLEKNVNKKKQADRKIINKFNAMLWGQMFDEYAEIKYLNYKNLDKLESALNPTIPHQNNLMRFCMLDMLKNPKVYE